MTHTKTFVMGPLLLAYVERQRQAVIDVLMADDGHDVGVLADTINPGEPDPTPRRGDRPMTRTTALAGPVTEPTALPCDWQGCNRPAVTVLRFHGQPGHVHDCAPHAATLREHCDVAASAPLPCTCGPDTPTWVDTPRELT